MHERGVAITTIRPTIQLGIRPMLIFALQKIGNEQVCDFVMTHFVKAFMCFGFANLCGWV